MTVASDIVILDYEMPRNLFSPTCLHTLYDTGCGLNRATHSLSGTAAAGSTDSQIYSGSTTYSTMKQGVLMFTTGANANVKATVRAVYPGVFFSLMYPLPFAPAVGDAFTVSLGCDHTQATCANVFGNSARFRGYPYVPPPEMAV